MKFRYDYSEGVRGKATPYTGIFAPDITFLQILYFI